MEDKKIRLIVVTQCRENYGSVEFPRWKMKFGDEIEVGRFTYNEAAKLGKTGFEEMVNEAKPLIDYYSDMSEEWVAGWDTVEGYTELEQEFLDYGDEPATRFLSDMVHEDCQEVPTQSDIDDHEWGKLCSAGGI